MVDTGACYGGELSAYCPETAAVRQVPGLRPWTAALAMPRPASSSPAG
jgi:serine/threonine protein phosphatase 1